MRISPDRQVRAPAQDLERMRAVPAVPELPGNRPDPLRRSRAGDRPAAARDLATARSLTLERSTRLRLLVVSAAVGLATAVVMLATEPRLAIVWDEGYTLGREARLRDWFRAIGRSGPDSRSDGDRSSGPRNWSSTDGAPAARARTARYPVEAPLRSPGRWNGSGPSRGRSRTAIRRSMRCSAWPATSSAPSWKDLPAARLGPILLFSFTAGAIFAFVAARWGRWAAALAAGSWVFQPNLFGHGHYAAYDAVLSSLWVLAILAFVPAIAPGTGPEPAAAMGLDARPSA